MNTFDNDNFDNEYSFCREHLGWYKTWEFENQNINTIFNIFRQYRWKNFSVRKQSAGHRFKIENYLKILEFYRVQGFIVFYGTQDEVNVSGWYMLRLQKLANLALFFFAPALLPLTTCWPGVQYVKSRLYLVWRYQKSIVERPAFGVRTKWLHFFQLFIEFVLVFGIKMISI